MSLFKRASIALICSLVLWGCQTNQPQRQSSTTFDRPLDKNIVERNALVDNWTTVKNHLNEVDITSLSRPEKIYCLYWMGAADYYLGRRIEAKEKWHRALSLKPTASMRDQLKQSLMATGESFITEQHLQLKGKWAVQLGLFSSHNTAEKLSQKLTWENYDVQLQEIFFNQKKVWVVWIGPYSKAKAKSVQTNLNFKGYTTILKKAESLL